MEQQDIDAVVRSWEAWAKGDLEAVFEIFDPSIEWDTSHFEGWPENELYRGQAEVRRFFAEWLANWDRYEAGLHEVRDMGDRVLTLCWQRALGKGSSVPVEMDWAQIITVRQGRILHIANYSDRAEALRAVELRERV